MKYAMDTIKEMTGANDTDAAELYKVIEEQALVDWSEASTRQLKLSFQLAQAYIRNGYSFEGIC